jgi:(2Fe-2S) ferredoxin
MKAFDCHIFVCENERDATNPRGCCASKGSKDFTAALKKLCSSSGTGGRRVRVNKAGCLDFCALGAVAVVYPEGTWYQGLTSQDAQEIYDSHILLGKPVERLMIKPSA